MIVKGLLRGKSCDIEKVLCAMPCSADILDKDDGYVEFICDSNKECLFRSAYNNDVMLDTVTYENDELYRCSLDERKKFKEEKIFFYVGACIENALKRYQFRF